MIDAMDKAAGLSEDDALFTARRFRPEFVQGAEACRLSVLQPVCRTGLIRLAPTPVINRSPYPISVVCIR